MKLIVLRFLTVKGENAYWKIEEEGKRQSWKDRQIAKRVAEDKVVSEKPLVVRIVVKIPWLAVQVKLDEQVRVGLEKKGAREGTDFKLEVE